MIVIDDCFYCKLTGTGGFVFRWLYLGDTKWGGGEDPHLRIADFRPATFLPLGFWDWPCQWASSHKISRHVKTARQWKAPGLTKR